MDCTWQATNDIVDTKQSYWFDNYFDGKPYDIKDFCKKCTPESLQRMHLDGWNNLKDMIDVNNMGLDIVNCTEGSPMSMFRRSTLEQEL